MSRRRRGTPTLIALHGHGDDPDSARRWGLAMAPPGWMVEAPRAPVSADGEPSWFDTGPRGVQRSSFEASTAQVGDLARRAAATGPVVVAGFSQGAALALALGELPAVVGTVAVCGFLPELEDIDLGAGPTALVLGAAEDEVVPAFLGEDAGAAMGAAGREVTVETLPGGHEVSPAACRRARSWLEQRWPGRLRITLGLPVDRVQTGSELVSGEAIAEMAATWERLGFAAAYVTDHPAPDDRWLAAGGHHALEPTVALAVAGSATSELLLHTHVFVLGYRNPFLAAKALASLDVVCGGRLVVGVAAGYLRAEFEAVGTSFDDRAARLDEDLELLLRIWSESGLGVERPDLRARSVTALPRPAQRPGPPLWVGGNSVAAMRRAVRFGAAWSPFPTPAGLDRVTRTAAIANLEDLEARLDRLGELCDELGRAESPSVCFGPFTMADYLTRPDEALQAMCEEAAAQWELGVDWLAMSVPGLGRAEVCDRAAALADGLGLQGPG